MPRPTSDDDSEPRPKVKKKKRKKSPGPNKSLILGLAIGGGFLLLAGIGTAIYFFTREKPVPVVKKDEFPGLMAHWSFDDADPGKDTSGRGNDGILNAGTIVTGKKNKGISFGGRDDQFIELSKGNDLNFKHDEAFT